MPRGLQVYPPDGVTYAYADIVNYTCAAWASKDRGAACEAGQRYYPDSYSSEVGARLGYGCRLQGTGCRGQGGGPRGIGSEDCAERATEVISHV